MVTWCNLLRNHDEVSACSLVHIDFHLTAFLRAGAIFLNRYWHYPAWYGFFLVICKQYVKIQSLPPLGEPMIPPPEFAAVKAKQNANSNWYVWLACVDFKLRSMAPIRDMTHLRQGFCGDNTFRFCISWPEAPLKNHLFACYSCVLDHNRNLPYAKKYKPRKVVKTYGIYIDFLWCRRGE